MITLSLDHHDFLCAVEGFARGSHLRQHVWEQIVYKSIPQMIDDDMDFLWFYMRRDLWQCYFYEIGGKQCTHVGYEYYLHAMAALHRGNRWKVKFRSDADKKMHLAVCYRFNKNWHPLFTIEGKKLKFQPSFCAFIPDEWIKTTEKMPMPDNRYVEQGKEQWWNDIDVYDINLEIELPKYI